MNAIFGFSISTTSFNIDPHLGNSYSLDKWLLNRPICWNKYGVQGVVWHAFTDKFIIKHHRDVQFFQFSLWSYSTEQQNLRTSNCTRWHYNFTSLSLWKECCVLVPLFVFEDDSYCSWLPSCTILKYYHRLIEDGSFLVLLQLNLELNVLELFDM